MKNNLLRKVLACTICAAFPFLQVSAQAFTENFDDITTLAGSGWVMTNMSSPIGTTGWEQGLGTAGGSFNAQNGGATSFISADMENVAVNGTISNWLITPNRTFRNGDMFTFWTRKVLPDTKPDQLEVRISTNGASTNVGNSATSVGDFTTFVTAFNPSLEAGGYPTDWVLCTVIITNQPAPFSGRIAFRYYVPNGGHGGPNSTYIGIDNVVYTPYTCESIVLSPASGALTGGSAGTAYSSSLTQVGALGSPNFAITAGALPPGLSLSASGTISGTPTATGTFNFTATVSDASGCSGSQSYSITAVCPSNPTSLNGLPALCENEEPYMLVEGSPAGGTYSGTGVSAGTFDPAAGTQMIVYDYTDPYGCAYATSATITVNSVPTVEQTAFAAACSNEEPVTLTGGSPADGTYSGTGVTAGEFDPASGTQTITYTYTDANGCANEATAELMVNTAPTVTQSAFAAACSNAGTIALTGASPAGGTYSGTGVTAGEFDPASGTQTITYTYTDANGCSNDATAEFTVNAAPTVTQSAFAAACSNAGTIALTGASPAGGTYSGTGVTGTDFDPTQGTQTITYTYTDANNCTSETTAEFTVNAAPTVTQSAFAAVCSNDGPIALSGGSPAGGVYSGTGVIENEFNPASGTQEITYTYTDANNCTSETIAELTVNAAPNVTFVLPVASICMENGALTLSGGIPAGGTYSGTAVTAGVFNPVTSGVGSQQLTYSFTDANGCEATATDAIAVESCLGIAENTQEFLNAYPNPGNGLFTIVSESAQPLTAVQIFDVQGKLVENATLTQNGSVWTADLTQTNNGMYILHAMQNNQPVALRLIKQ